jgi:hypothetical protein
MNTRKFHACTIILLFLSFAGISQTIFKSKFNNLKFTTKDTKKEYVSPNYETTFIIINLENKIIGIHVFDEGNYMEPIILNQARIISESSKNNLTAYYCIEGYYLTHYHNENEFLFHSENESIKQDWRFEDIELSNSTVYDNYSNSYDPNNSSRANYSENSQNMIGYDIERVKYKFSKNYEEPIKGDPSKMGFPSSNSLLLFMSKDFPSTTFFIFDEGGICKQMKISYPLENLEEFKGFYNQSYGYSSKMKWIENTDNKNYIYWFEIEEMLFTINIKAE